MTELALRKGPDGIFYEKLYPEVVASPGISYYIEVEDAVGNQVRSPKYGENFIEVLDVIIEGNEAPEVLHSKVKDTVEDTSVTFSNAINGSVDFRRYSNFSANITVSDVDLLNYSIFSSNASGVWSNKTAVAIGGASYRSVARTLSRAPRLASTIRIWTSQVECGSKSINTIAAKTGERFAIDDFIFCRAWFSVLTCNSSHADHRFSRAIC